MEGAITMNKKQRQVYQLAMEVICQKLTIREFFIGETSLHCLKVMKDITEIHGIPDAYYLDEAGCFGKKDQDQDRTQIGRALESLDTKVIIAGYMGRLDLMAKFFRYI